MSKLRGMYMYHKFADKLANILILLAEKEVVNNKSKDVEVPDRYRK